MAKKITNLVLAAELKKLTERVDQLEMELESLKPKESTIQHTEKHDVQTEPKPREEAGLKMSFENKIQSMMNAIAILPPNRKNKNTGRHAIADVQAVCGFLVDKEMMDAAYKRIGV